MNKIQVVILTISALVFTVLAVFFQQYLDVVILSLVVAVIFLVLLVVTLQGQRFIYQGLFQSKKEIEKLELLLERQTNIESQMTLKSPMGIVMLDENYKIVWSNESAQKIFENTLKGRSLETINHSLFDAIVNTGFPSFKHIKIYQNYYEVVYQSDIKTLYFKRITEYTVLKQNYEAHTSVVGWLHLDHLEESLSVLELQEKNQIQGEYLGALDDWADEYNMYLIPVTANKLFVSMHRKDLDALIEDEFSVIEDISNISKKHELMVTLSGGFAASNRPLIELGDIASDALDLALSRGGDQIVIKVETEQLKYFGGNANTQEKRTRISSRINAQKLLQLCQASKHVFIMPHSRPDADAFGAAIGVLKMALASNTPASIVIDLKALDKTVKKIIQAVEYEYVTFLEYIISPEEALIKADDRSLLVLVDHHSQGQALSEPLLNRIERRVIIDHHRKLSDFVAHYELAYIEPYASSSTELVIEMIHVFPKTIDINPLEATIMLSGMMVDTNNFMYRTGSRTFEAAAVLRKHGADPFKVKNMLRESLKEIQIKAELISEAEVVKKRFSIVIVPEHIVVTRELLAKVADDLLEIDHTVAAFTIGQLDANTIGISARSLEGFNVQVLMEKFGGGGHLNNAGAQLTNSNKKEIKDKLVDLLETAIQEERPMKVILLKDLKGRGKKNSVIEVAAGYGNYLLTSKQAIEATPENMQILADEQSQQEAQKNKELEEAKTLKQQIDHRAIKIYMRIGESGKFYGKITTKQIADAIQKQYDITIDKRKIVLEQNITALGTYSIPVKLHKDVQAIIELLVVEEKTDGR